MSPFGVFEGLVCLIDLLELLFRPLPVLLRGEFIRVVGVREKTVTLFDLFEDSVRSNAENVVVISHGLGA